MNELAALKNRGEWSMESYEEPSVAFGKQKEPLWVVRCRLLVRADRQRIAVIP